MKTKNLPAQPTKISDYMKTEEKYKSTINQNKELKPIEVTKVISDDPMIRLLQMSREQEVFTTTETGPIKKRDKLYFARLGARLADESAERIKKELEEERKNQQTQ